MIILIYCPLGIVSCHDIIICCIVVMLDGHLGMDSHVKTCQLSNEIKNLKYSFVLTFLGLSEIFDGAYCCHAGIRTSNCNFYHFNLMTCITYPGTVKYIKLHIQTG